MTTRMTPRTRAEGSPKTVYGFKKASLTIGTGKCDTCMAEIKPGRRGERKRFCSLKCRQRAWAVRILLAALKAGYAEGLRQKIREMGGRA